MLIIAGVLRVAAEDRDGYLSATFDVAVQARAAPGCLDFVQAADPVDPERINIYERWTSEEDLHRFRNFGGSDLDLPEVRSMDVHKYRISSIEDP